MKVKPNIIVIAGPTASGKSVLAVKLSKKRNGEIVSADSRQVYRGLDIGTAKITKKEMCGILHHCIGIAEAKKAFSVEQFQKAATKAIEVILKKGKTPIIVGGTGFYIDAIIYDSAFPAVPPNPKLRLTLRHVMSKLLFAKLKKLDPVRAKNIDAKNPRRLIRAIEIARALGKVPKIKRTPRYAVEYIYLDPPAEKLRKNIARRTEKMLKRGLLAEVRKLIRQKLPRKRIVELGFEYKYPLLYLEGKISREEMVKEINTKTWHYAKRQRTWFKKALSGKALG